MTAQTNDMTTTGDEYPSPTTKPGGKDFSVASIVLALVSLVFGGVILSGVALGLAIGAERLGQRYMVPAGLVSSLAFMVNLAAYFYFRSAGL